MSQKTKKGYTLTCMEEGYEDPIMKRFEEEKNKIKKENEVNFEQKNFNFFTKRRIIIIIAWIILYKIFIRYGFGMM